MHIDQEINSALTTARRVIAEAQELSRWQYAADKDALTRRAVVLMHEALDLASKRLEQARKEGA